MAQAPRIKQITAESTPEVRAKLRLLEQELASDKARGYEIVGVLIKRAKASHISTSALHTYRAELNREREHVLAIRAVCSFIEAFGR